MPYADLHVHTTRSDGSLALEAVPEAARRGGVEVVAVTDHDRVQPFDGPVVERDGVTLVHGIELRVETPGGQRIDLLGYGLEPSASLEAILADIQDNRIERGRAIVDCVESRLGIDLDVTVDGGFGRPHIARAIEAHPETEYDYQARSITSSAPTVRVTCPETSRRSRRDVMHWPSRVDSSRLHIRCDTGNRNARSRWRPTSTPSNSSIPTAGTSTASRSSKPSNATTCLQPAAATPTTNAWESTASLGVRTTDSSWQTTNPNPGR